MENTCEATLGRILEPAKFSLLIDAIQVAYQSSQVIGQVLQNNPILMGVPVGGLLGPYVKSILSRLLLLRQK